MSFGAADFRVFRFLTGAQPSRLLFPQDFASEAACAPVTKIKP